MSLTDLVTAALQLGVIPTLALFLVLAMYFQNRQLLKDRHDTEARLLSTITQLFSDYQSAQKELRSEAVGGQQRMIDRGDALEISRAADHDVAILTLKGELSTGSEGRLISSVGTALAEGFKGIVLDLGGLKHVDSSGIGALVSVATSALRGGGNLFLANVTAKVRDVLEVTQLITVFEVFPTPEAAVEAIRQEFRST
jgi:anti-sigma B factor antagonist